MEAINLFWMLSPNFGDAMNPWLVERITGRDVVFVDRDVGLGKYVCCGSILNYATERCVVWGAGLGRMVDGVDPAADIRAVRGPLSGAIARRHGAKCPSVYGDPALLLPRYYSPSVPKRYRFGVVAHFAQQHFVLGTAKASGWIPDDVVAIDILDPVEKVIDAILSCERIVSSALHGLIVAGAYGIPSAWISFDDPIGGDGVKFIDYSLSVGCGVIEVASLPHAAESLRPERLAQLDYRVPATDLTDGLVACCPLPMPESA